jgi:hypothetical protein
MPEGEGLAGHHAKQGYMLFLNVMLRPVLLTIGLIMSFLIMWGGAWLVMEGMKVFTAGMISAPQTGVLSWLGGNFISALIGMFAVLLIGTVLLVMVIHRAFDIIYEAADEVLAWIGGGKQLGGEAQHVGKTQAVVAGQFSRVENRGLNALGMGKKGMNMNGNGDAGAPSPTSAVDTQKQEDLALGDVKENQQGVGLNQQGKNAHAQLVQNAYVQEPPVNAEGMTPHPAKTRGTTSPSRSGGTTPALHVPQTSREAASSGSPSKVGSNTVHHPDQRINPKRADVQSHVPDTVPNTSGEHDRNV